MKPSQGFPRGLFFCPEVSAVPRKPKRPCNHPGCPRLTDGLYCEEHRREENARYNKYERNPESNRRYGRTWKRVRALYISAHPLCEECLKQSRVTPAEEVHHILPLSRRGTNDTSNLMALCKSCHSRISAESGDRWPGRN